MPAGQRVCGRMLGLILLCTLVVWGCKRDAESGKPTPSASSIIGDNQADSTRGDERSAAPSENAAAPTIAPADSADATGAPSYLPHSDAVSGWVKHEPIQVASAAGAAELLGGELTQRIRHFGYNRIARCGYARYAGGTLVTVEVQAIETESATDAYGIMSVVSDGGAVEAIGGETRVVLTATSGLYACWQGKTCLRLVCRGDCQAAADGIDRLLMQITAGIHREDLPPIMEAIPLEGGLPSKRWLVRQLDSLPSDATQCATPTEIAEISTLLGLGRETLMCVAAFRIPDAQQDNIVWLVQYPDAITAAEAYDRYMRRLEGATGGVWEKTNLMAPHGRYMIGTWTVAEESMQYIMPRIAQLLPA